MDLPLSHAPATESPVMRPTVVVAGASGFVGKALAGRLSGEANLIGLTRRQREAGDGYDAWRCCDLFSLGDAEQALEGADYAVYLVHSMMPSASMTQGRFEDLDLICADNFGRAAHRALVKQIVYLGGLLPEADELSRHLESRHEVERTLAGYGVPVTTLRAGLVVGAEGSSFQMMLRLVERLPVMIAPRWTTTSCQPIALEDVVQLIRFVLGRRECFAQVFDVGGPDVLTYREMMQITADVLGVKRSILRVPVLTPKLSRLWVSTITGSAKELVQPLIHSLAHSMVAKDLRLQEQAGLPGLSFRDSVRNAIEQRRGPTLAPRPQRPRKRQRLVRSVQRLPLPPGRNAAWVAAEYLRWLPTGIPGIEVRVDSERVCRFSLRGVSAPLLVLAFAPERSTQDRQLFRITGGVLSATGQQGRLEMREAPDRRSVITAIHDYAPRLPWLVYRSTQAELHLYVMGAFGRHLQGLCEPKLVEKAQAPEETR